jgi:DNA-binding transcriptional ArsR family regulator
MYDAVAALDDYEAAPITGAGARSVKGAPDTSAAAAGLAEPVQYSARHRVITILARRHPTVADGMTDDELERASGNSHQTISSARNWLVEAGWVRDTGIRRMTRSNRQAVVWELTPAARQQLKGGTTPT